MSSVQIQYNIRMPTKEGTIRICLFHGTMERFGNHSVLNASQILDSFFGILFFVCVCMSYLGGVRKCVRLHWSSREKNQSPPRNC